MATEEPRYTVLVSDPPFEVRRYAAFTVAQTQINGDFDTASSGGFRRLRITASTAADIKHAILLSERREGGREDEDGREEGMKMSN